MRPSGNPRDPRSPARRNAQPAGGQGRLSCRGFHAPAGATHQPNERESIRVVAQQGVRTARESGRGGRWKPHTKEWPAASGSAATVTPGATPGSRPTPISPRPQQLSKATLLSRQEGQRPPSVAFDGSTRRRSAKWLRRTAKSQRVRGRRLRPAHRCHRSHTLRSLRMPTGKPALG